MRINVLKQRQIEAAAAVQVAETGLNALLDLQATARASYRSLLKQAADGNLKTDEDKRKLADAEAHAESFEARLSAQRKLVAEAKAEQGTAAEELRVETERLAREDAILAQQPSRIPSITGGTPRAALDPSRGFAGHSDFLRAVMRASMTGQMDERLRPLVAQGSDEQQAAASPYGEFFVPVAIAPGVLSVSPELDPLETLVTAVPMTAPSVKFNARVDKSHATSVSGGFRVYRHAETVDGTSSRGEFEQVTLTANEEMGVAFATETILTDSPESFVAIIRAGMGSEFIANRINERINGTGVGERQGALVTPCVIDVAKETNQAAATIKKENIDKMAARCWRYQSAVWLANHNTLPQLLSIVQVVGTGGAPVPYFSFAPGGQMQLLGRPLFFTEFAKTLGTSGDLILGVWSEHLDGNYQSEQFAESMHVRFLAAERAFRFYRRNDGQWWWRSALTPRAGSTLSPVVTLATRA